MQLLSSLELNIVKKWIVFSARSTDFADARVIPLDQIFQNLTRLIDSYVSFAKISMPMTVSPPSSIQEPKHPLFKR